MKITHENMMGFVLESVGANNESIAKQIVLENLEKAFGEILAPPFGAGETRSTHPGTFSHGDIEEIALENFGYSLGEIKQIYFGNWLRDYSQAITGASVGFTKADREKIAKHYGKLMYVRELQPLFWLMPMQQTWVSILELLALKEFVFDKSKSQNDSKNLPKNLYSEFKKI